MKPRAFLYDRGEFYFPEDDSPRALAEFYTVLEGYRMRGEDYEITWTVGLEDDSGREVYSGDIVEITDMEFGIAQERGTVEYAVGSFIVINNSGMVYDFQEQLAAAPDDTFSLKVIGHVYQEKKAER